jgi:hypothetical protein
MTYFNDLWTLPSPSAMMEGTGHHGMAMPLSVDRSCILYSPTSFHRPDPTPAQELDPVLEPIWAQGSLTDTDSLDLVFPSDEVIIEAMTSPDRPWDDLHHRSYFLPELRRIEAGEFTLTMTGDKACPINPLAMHIVYAEGNMETIAKMIPIDISRTPGIMENVFVRADCSPEEMPGIDPRSVEHEQALLSFKLALKFESNILVRLHLCFSISSGLTEKSNLTGLLLSPFQTL